MKPSRTVAFSKHSTNIFFHILTQCNLRCQHCYINPDQHGRQMLDAETIEAWLAAFSDKAGRANVIFLGGEPTLHPDLARVVKTARRLGYLSITIDTNGYLFHDFLDRVTPADVDFISFSLDGATRQTNDAIRGQGVYETCLKGIGTAVDRGFSVSMIYTVSQRNLGELEMMVPLVADLKIQRFFLQVIGIRGKSVATSASDLQVTRHQWLEQVPRVASRIAESGITVTYPKVYLDPEEPFECAGLCADNYFIFPNGRVYRCPICEDYPLHSLEFQDNKLIPVDGIHEQKLFELTIPEGCVMNRLIQPSNLSYTPDGKPKFRVACCMLKEEVGPYC